MGDRRERANASSVSRNIRTRVGFALIARPFTRRRAVPRSPAAHLRLMASPYAFVTLLTSDAYLPGALTLAAALKDVHPSPPASPEVDFQTVCLVTPETVDVSSIKLLRRAFNVVIGVEIIEHDNECGLQLLGAPNLSVITRPLLLYTRCARPSTLKER